MVREDGATKLADFGIASVQGDPRLTATGLVVGLARLHGARAGRGRTGEPGHRPVGARRHPVVRGRGPASLRRGRVPDPERDRQRPAPPPPAPRRPGPGAGPPAGQGPGQPRHPVPAPAPAAPGRLGPGPRRRPGPRRPGRGRRHPDRRRPLGRSHGRRGRPRRPHRPGRAGEPGGPDRPRPGGPAPPRRPVGTGEGSSRGTRRRCRAGSGGARATATRRSGRREGRRRTAAAPGAAGADVGGAGPRRRPPAPGPAPDGLRRRGRGARRDLRLAEPHPRRPGAAADGRDQAAGRARQLAQLPGPGRDLPAVVPAHLDADRPGPVHRLHRAGRGALLPGPADHRRAGPAGGPAEPGARVHGQAPRRRLPAAAPGLDHLPERARGRVGVHLPGRGPAHPRLRHHLHRRRPPPRHPVPGPGQPLGRLPRRAPVLPGRLPPRG